jgi:hypothetical protein
VREYAKKKEGMGTWRTLHLVAMRKYGLEGRYLHEPVSDNVAKIRMTTIKVLKRKAMYRKQQKGKTSGLFSFWRITSCCSSGERPT